MNLFSINSAVIRNANNQNYEITSINYVEIIYLIERFERILEWNYSWKNIIQVIRAITFIWSKD